MFIPRIFYSTQIAPVAVSPENCDSYVKHPTVLNVCSKLGGSLSNGPLDIAPESQVSSCPGWAVVLLAALRSLIHLMVDPAVILTTSGSNTIPPAPSETSWISITPPSAGPSGTSTANAAPSDTISSDHPPTPSKVIPSSACAVAFASCVAFAFAAALPSSI